MRGPNYPGSSREQHVRASACFVAIVRRTAEKVHGRPDDLKMPMADFRRVIQAAGAEDLATRDELLAIRCASKESLLAACSRSGGTGTGINLGLLREAQDALDGLADEDDAILLAQLLMLAILLTNKHSVHLVRTMNELTENRMGALGINRISSVCGCWVLWCFEDLRGVRVDGSLLARAGIAPDVDGRGVWEPIFASLCYRLKRLYEV